MYNANDADRGTGPTGTAPPHMDMQVGDKDIKLKTCHDKDHKVVVFWMEVVLDVVVR